MTPAAFELCIDKIVALTALGGRVADLACDSALLAIGLAQAGRRVSTFGTRPQARERIEAQPREIRDRIAVSAAPFDGRACGAKFDVAFADGLLCEAVEPAELIARARSVCTDAAPLVFVCPDGPARTPHAAIWSFTAATLEFALRAFGRPVIEHPVDRTALCATLWPRASHDREPPRLAVLMRLTTEDRFVNESLAGVADIAGLIVTLDDNIPDRSFEVVRNHQRVAHTRRIGPRPPAAQDEALAQTLARAWKPDWIFTLGSSELLGPASASELTHALRSAPAGLTGITLGTTMLWDGSDQQRSDVPATYARRVRLMRARCGPIPAIADGVAQVIDYAYADPGLRALRKAVALIGRHDTADDWKLSAAAALQPASAIVRRPDARAQLLTVALARPRIDAQRILCIDPDDLDASRIIGTTWPAGAITATSAASALHTPYSRPYGVTLRGVFNELDLELVFGTRPFDAIIDCDLAGDPDEARTRLARIRSLLPSDGSLVTIVDESRSALTLDDLLNVGRFGAAGFTIDAIDVATGAFGGRVAVLCAHVRAQHAAPRHPLTIVVPAASPSDRPLAEAAYDAVIDEARSSEVAVVIAQTWSPGAAASAAERATVCVFEPGIDAAVAAAFERYPAAAVCVLEAGTVVPSGWCRSVLAALAAESTGILALSGSEVFDNGNVVDGPVLVVKTQAVHPYAWPRGWSDDRIRAAVLAGIAARGSFAARTIAPVITSARARRRESGARAVAQRARAERLGVPGGTFSLDDRANANRT